MAKGARSDHERCDSTRDSGLVQFQVVLALLLFLPAGTWRYWAGWVYWLLFCMVALATTLYLLKRDPGLVERRLSVGPRAERRPRQKIIQALASALICAVYVVAGLDHRWNWSSVPLAIVIVGNLLFVGSFIVFLFVFRQNSLASAVVEVQSGQRVVTTGLYGIVRHPMYVGAVLFFLATQLRWHRTGPFPWVCC